MKKPAIMLVLALLCAACSPAFHRNEFKAKCGIAPVEMMGWHSPKMARVMMDKMKPADLKQLEGRAFQRSLCLQKQARETANAAKQAGFPQNIFGSIRAKAYAAELEAAKAEWTAFADAQTKPALVGAPK